MATIEGNKFELERRAFLWNKDITLDDKNTSLLYDGNPNDVTDGKTPGESKLYSLKPANFFYQSAGALWLKVGQPNIWVKLNQTTAGLKLPKWLANSAKPDNIPYHIDETVWFPEDDKIYVCITENTDENFVPGNWKELSVGGAGSGGGSGIWILNVEPANFNDNVGDKVYLEGGSNVLVSCLSDTVDVKVTVLAALGVIDTKPTAKVNDVSVVFDENHVAKGGGSLFEGVATIQLDGNLITAVHEDGAERSVAVTMDTKPVISACSFAGGYPVGQTEVKAADAMQITVEADTEFVRVEVADEEACVGVSRSVASTLGVTVAVQIADRGVTAVARPAKVRVQKSTGAWSDWVLTNKDGGVIDGIDTVVCNNLHPTISLIRQNNMVYPGTQRALKDSESVTISCACTDFDTILYTSPNSDLGIADPTTYLEEKEVTRSAGSYNVSEVNYRVACVREANAATSSSTGIVFIANTEPSLTVQSPNHIRSGGADGTTMPSHTIQINSTQDLLEPPTLSEGTTGTWVGTVFSGNGTVWQRMFVVNDNEDKGVFPWGVIAAVNLAGKPVSTITSGGTYTVSGFEEREITLLPQQNEAVINVAVTDYASLSALWEAKALPNKRAVGTTAVPDSNSWCIDALQSNPTTIRILDIGATNASSVPTTIIVNEI